MNPIPYHLPYSVHRTTNLDSKRLRVKSRRKLSRRIKLKTILCTDVEAGTLGSAMSQIMDNGTTSSTSIAAISTTSSSIANPIISSAAISSETSTSTTVLGGSNEFNHSRISTTQTILSACFLSLFFFIATVVALYWYIKLLNRQKSVDTAAAGSKQDSEISDKSILPPTVSAPIEEIPAPTLISTATRRNSSETIRLASSRESTRTIRAILQDSLTPRNSIHELGEEEAGVGAEVDDETQSILSIERPHSPVLAALLRAYQEAQDSNEDDSLKSIPMSSSSIRTITLKDPILVISNNNLPTIEAEMWKERKSGVGFSSSGSKSSDLKRRSIISTSTQSFNTACSKLEEEQDIKKVSVVASSTSANPLDEDDKNLNLSLPESSGENKILEVPIVNMSGVDEDSKNIVKSDQNVPVDVDEGSGSEVEDDERVKKRMSSKQNIGVRSEAFINARAKFED